ncbi:ABC transporter permease [Leptospira limi]|uniref:ABC transporter permease n=1 Tax=Leptospira limi TaxID=2950023 RepID=A0ABT3M046_9LEPT|nr:ABC transporter permease [Leptospira limi]MCW7463349.1 ABC transporter permease [Leptospira limi]
MIHLYLYFIFGYLKNNLSKVFFNLVSIILGIALFVSTQINGWKAEKSLVDQTIGFNSQNLIGRYVPNSTQDEVDTNTFYSMDAILPEAFHLEPELFIKGYTILEDNQSLSLPIIGRDLITFSPHSNNQNKQKIFQKYFISKSLLQKTKITNARISIHLCNQILTINLDEILPIEGDGLFFVTDIERLQSICGLKNTYSAINIINDNSLKNVFSNVNLSQLPRNQNWKYESINEIKERAGVALGSLKINLTIISLVSVLISFFMVSNIYTGIFLSRKIEFGILLSIGGTRLNNFLLFMTLALLLGLVGGIIGTFLGITLANFNFFQTSNTITDSTQIESYREFPIMILFYGIFLSIAGSILSALFNAIKAYNIFPIEMLKDRNEPTRNPNNNFQVKWIISFLFIFTGIIIGCLKIQKQILPGLIGVSFVILGFILINYVSIPIIVKGISKFSDKFNLSPSFILAIKEIEMESWKNGLTISTVMLATSLVFTLSSLTLSYESSLKRWIHEENQSDFSLINEKKLNSGEPGVPINLLDKLKNANLFSDVEPFFINSKFIVNGNYFTLHVLKFRENENKDEIFVSKNLCYLEKICKGDLLKISTPYKGDVNLRVQNEKENFFSERGTIIMDYSLYKSLFPIQELNSIRITISNLSKKDEAVKTIEELAIKNELIYLDQKKLEDLYLMGMNRVFSVLDSLKLTAILISLLSLATSIFYYVKEKSRILAGLKAIGMNFLQIFLLLFYQTIFLLTAGITSGIFNSLILSPIVIFGINQNAFGWNLIFTFPVHFVANLPILILLYATLITIIPFYFVYRMRISNELNYE